MTDRRRTTRRTSVTAALAALIALVATGAALAAGAWPQAGGDGGRSGNQVLSAGPGTMRAMWSRSFAPERLLQGGAIVTATGFAGAPPRVVYGTQDGRVHLRDAYTGAAVGPEDGTALSASPSPDPFRGHAGGLTAVETTDADGYGQVFVVHNDDDQADPATTDPEAEFPDDIAIAQLDAETGRLVQVVAVPGTDGYTVSAPPLLTEPDASGVRHLVFTAVNREDWEAEDRRPANQRANVPTAFSVPLRGARHTSATIDTANTTMATFDSLNPLVPPALVALADELAPEEPAQATPYVAFGTGDPDAPVQLRSPDLSESGPSSPRLDRDASATRRVYVNAIAVPVAGTGRAPGTAGSGVLRAPLLYVSTYDTDSRQTTVHRVVPSPDGASLVVAASSAPVTGRGGPLIATSQVGGGAGVTSGRVVVGTGTDLVALKGSDLSRSWRLDETPGRRRPGADGFQATGPTLVGDTAVLLTDAGHPVVVDRDTGTPVPGERFGSSPQLDVDEHAALSPAAGSGVVVLAGDRGLTVYATACGNRIDGAEGNDTIPGTPTGDDVRGRGGIDLLDLRGGDDCADGAVGDDRIDGGDGDDRLDAGAGDDLLLGGAGHDRLLGGAGTDQLLGGSDDDVLTGGLGNDLLKGATGNDQLDGGDGADRMTGGDGNDRLDGSSGNDALKGNAGDDVLIGGPGRDKLDGGAGDDVINAAVNAGSSGNTIIGGSGNDKIFAVNRVKDVVRCGSGIDSAQVDHQDTVTGCEVVTRRRAPKRKARR